jgi:hypothetical protein
MAWQEEIQKVLPGAQLRRRIAIYNSKDRYWIVNAQGRIISRKSNHPDGAWMDALAGYRAGRKI